MTKVLYREFFALVALLWSACPLVLAEEPQLKPAIKNSAGGGGQPIALSASHVRKDVGAAKKMAALRWFDKMALADPQLVESITAYSSSASILARHPHLDKIAEADPYLCRRLTRWRGAARVLARNPKAYKVVARDPEGIYRAIKNDRSYAKLLSKNPYFNQMVVENPELGRVLSRYM
ncbi:MAG: hypothetical protein IPK73_09785 [Candidatus Obscuribacter sp.]|nr:hypothetical protein [Candidatus Obscuribacter sp.]